MHTDGSSTLNLGLGKFQDLLSSILLLVLNDYFKGIYQQVGHVDFYPNGGFNQPDCPKTNDKLINIIAANFDLVALEEGVTCSHNSVQEMFTDSISKKCKYTSYPCNSEKDFDKAECLKCGPKGCNNMGYWASSDKDMNKLYLNTQSVVEEPFCLENYRFFLVSAESKMMFK